MNSIAKNIKKIIVNYSPSKLLKKGEQKSYNCGYLFLQNLYYDLMLDKICKTIHSRHSFAYDLNDILAKLIFTRILYPSSKHAANKQASIFIEQPNFKLHDIYRALSVLAQESDFVQSELYKNSQTLFARVKIFFIMIVPTITLKQNKQMIYANTANPNNTCHFHWSEWDCLWIPMAFLLLLIFPLEIAMNSLHSPLEHKIIRDYGLEKVIVCTDAGLSSKANRKFNDKTIDDEHLRSFITTQSVKQLPNYIKEFAIDPQDWHLTGSEATYNIDEIRRN